MALQLAAELAVTVPRGIASDGEVAAPRSRQYSVAPSCSAGTYAGRGAASRTSLTGRLVVRLGND